MMLKCEACGNYIIGESCSFVLCPSTEFGKSVVGQVMSAEMIQRVAEALRLKNFELWGEINEFGISDYAAEVLARTAIEALRDPTDAMIRALPNVACSEQSYIYEGQFLKGWQAMIDEALKENQS